MSNRSCVKLVGNTTQVQNIGTGDGLIFKQKISANILQLRSIKEGPNIKIIQDGDNITVSGASGGGVNTFIQLTDTPSNYSGNADCYIKVNSNGSGLEFANSPVGGSDGQIQYNDNSSFGGTSLSYDNSTNTFSLSGGTLSTTNALLSIKTDSDYDGEGDFFSLQAKNFIGDYVDVYKMGFDGLGNGTLYMCGSNDQPHILYISGFGVVNIDDETCFNNSVKFYQGSLSAPSVTGSRGGNAALASLLNELDSLGLIINSTTT